MLLVGPAPSARPPIRLPIRSLTVLHSPSPIMQSGYSSGAIPKRSSIRFSRPALDPLLEEDLGLRFSATCYPRNTGRIFVSWSQVCASSNDIVSLVMNYSRVIASCWTSYASSRTCTTSAWSLAYTLSIKVYICSCIFLPHQQTLDCEESPCNAVEPVEPVEVL